MRQDDIIAPSIGEVIEGEGKEELPGTDEAVAVEAREPLPKLVAKGKGEMARAIIGLAKKFDIPIYEDPDLLESLALLDVGSKIPDRLYQLIAEIILFIYKANKRFGYEPSS